MFLFLPIISLYCAYNFIYAKNLKIIVIISILIVLHVRNIQFVFKTLVFFYLIVNIRIFFIFIINRRETTRDIHIKKI